MATNSPPCTEKLPSPVSVANSATTEHQQRLPADGSNNRQPFPPSSGRKSDENMQNNGQRQRKKRFGNKLKPHELDRQNKLLLEETFASKNYKKFFNVKLEENLNLANINVIKANKQMTAQLKGRPKKVTELKDGSLLVKVNSEEQSVLIRKIAKLDETKVTVVEHPTVNTIKGAIRYKNSPNFTEDDIFQELKQSQVTEIYRVKRKISDVIENTNIYILTFDRCILPKEVFIGWTRCEVKEYIPRPRRCFKCHAFNHGGKACRSDVSICVRCGDKVTHRNARDRLSVRIVAIIPLHLQQTVSTTS